MTSVKHRNLPRVIHRLRVKGGCVGSRPTARRVSDIAPQKLMPQYRYPLQSGLMQSRASSYVSRAACVQ